jgi:hypothetical protein
MLNLPIPINNKVLEVEMTEDYDEWSYKKDTLDKVESWIDEYFKEYKRNKIKEIVDDWKD